MRKLALATLFFSPFVLGARPGATTVQVHSDDGPAPQAPAPVPQTETITVPDPSTVQVQVAANPPEAPKTRFWGPVKKILAVTAIVLILVFLFLANSL